MRVLWQKYGPIVTDVGNVDKKSIFGLIHVLNKKLKSGGATRETTCWHQAWDPTSQAVGECLTVASTEKWVFHIHNTLLNCKYDSSHLYRPTAPERLPTEVINR